MAGETLRSIAARLGRAPSTVSRELKRNGGREGYRATQADSAAWDRALRPKRCKLAENRALAGVTGPPESPLQVPPRSFPLPCVCRLNPSFNPLDRLTRTDSAIRRTRNEVAAFPDFAWGLYVNPYPLSVNRTLCRPRRDSPSQGRAVSLDRNWPVAVGNPIAGDGDRLPDDRHQRGENEVRSTRKYRRPCGVPGVRPTQRRR